MQSMYDQVVNCIKKPPSERTYEEANQLYPWFIKKSELFASLKPEVVKDIIRNCDFTEAVRDNVVIRQGDKGDCFYIILSGRVSIFINTDAVPDNPEEATVLVAEDTFNETGKGGQKMELDRTRYGNYIVSFDAGKSFGELALINKDCVRNASIIADERTHLLVVDRYLYNRSLRAAQEAEFRQRIDFVQNCNLFDKWQARYKRQAAMSLRKETLQFNMNVVRQGDPVNGLAFIRQGLAKVTVDALMHNTQYPSLHLQEDPEEHDKKDMLGELNDQIEKECSFRPKLWEKPLRRQGYAAAEQRQAQKHIEISLVGPGECIGDIEHGMHLDTYAQSIVCTQETFVYYLDAKNFERLINARRNPRTLQLLRKKAEMKLLSRVAVSMDKQISLIRHLVYKIEDQYRQEERTTQNRELILEKVDVGDMRWTNTDSFIPKRGPLIDLYGPGTVFYRNRMKRLAKLAKLKAKQHAQREMMGARTGGRGVVMFGAMATLEDNVSGDEDEEEIRAHRFEKKPSRVDIDDWETSSSHLNVLESRLKDWQKEINDLDKSRVKEKVVELRRFKSQETSRVYPGKKIFLRPRPPAIHPNLDKEEHLDENGRALLDDEEVFITASSHPFTQRIVTKPLSMLRDKNETQNQDGLDSEDLPKSANSDRLSAVPGPAPAFTRSRAKTDLNEPRPSRANLVSPGHQYTVKEYKTLRELLKKKERQMAVFRSSLSI